jgi:hypothetical protein
MNDQDRQIIIDEEHLKLLSIGYIISAAITAFFSLFGLMYVFIGLMFALTTTMTNTSQKTGAPPPPAVGWFFVGFGMVIFTLMITIAILKFRAGRCIKRRRSRTYCMVIAAISCLFIPYGTFLGVCTFIVLGRNSVKALFDKPNLSSISC